ncbi:DNA polymerase sliding clamp [Sulfolobus acidocaldarius]|uniref:DNA polymerase sliding clamp n=4 Tax=Sulfolobus acidocaldarius TaxID=2285 RepID=Q4JAJ5_SULAC|nr:DNA polymerase sliding clamp [Sulfolobus acidocaldarius]AAY80184.1 DNA polymerase sliding clamp B [Sulfolobus acidocaldarius DSM 639]AGE70763.1 DNA polymerase sliding clamp [Sulfolobus acidocaldarius N8]AGE73034.1 DNA polymerase sliding clamp [Sulfolobus acidocaldarius Ron12/I]ALU28910.1 DNA polymerase [Sulfolobus acidocaldarius]ALU31635.1 DNA polymerase [Sulfolobus acidocaldarius]
MIKAIYGSAKDFYDIIQGVSNVTDSITLYFTEEEVMSRYLTEDKTLMVLLKISKEYMEEYIIEKPLGIKIQLNELKKVLNKAKSKSAVINIEETDAGMKITVRDEKTGLKSSIYLKGEKITNIENVVEPKVGLTISFTCSGNIIKNVVDEASSISEQIQIEGDDNQIIFSTEESGRGYKAYLVMDKPLKGLEIQSSGKSTYGVEVLKTALKASAFSENLTVRFGNNIPMKIEAPVQSGGQLIFWIAPRLS